MQTFARKLAVSTNLLLKQFVVYCHCFLEDAQPLIKIVRLKKMEVHQSSICLFKVINTNNRPKQGNCDIEGLIKTCKTNKLGCLYEYFLLLFRKEMDK